MPGFFYQTQEKTKAIPWFNANQWFFNLIDPHWDVAPRQNLGKLMRLIRTRVVARGCWRTLQETFWGAVPVSWCGRRGLGTFFSVSGANTKIHFMFQNKQKKSQSGKTILQAEIYSFQSVFSQKTCCVLSTIWLVFGADFIEDCYYDNYTICCCMVTTLISVCLVL